MERIEGPEHCSGPPRAAEMNARLVHPEVRDVHPVEVPDEAGTVQDLVVEQVHCSAHGVVPAKFDRRCGPSSLLFLASVRLPGSASPAAAHVPSRAIVELHNRSRKRALSIR